MCRDLSSGVGTAVSLTHLQFISAAGSARPWSQPHLFYQPHSTGLWRLVPSVQQALIGSSTRSHPTVAFQALALLQTISNSNDKLVKGIIIEALSETVIKGGREESPWRNNVFN